MAAAWFKLKQGAIKVLISTQPFKCRNKTNQIQTDSTKGFGLWTFSSCPVSNLHSLCVHTLCDFCAKYGLVDLKLKFCNHWGLLYNFKLKQGSVKGLMLAKPLKHSWFTNISRPWSSFVFLISTIIIIIIIMIMVVVRWQDWRGRSPNSWQWPTFHRRDFVFPEYTNGLSVPTRHTNRQTCVTQIRNTFLKKIKHQTLCRPPKKM